MAADRPELVLQTGHAEKVDGIAFSPDGRLLGSAGADGTVKLWDVTLGRELRTLGGHAGGVKAVAFSPDGERLASGGFDGKVRLWEIRTGRELGAFPGHAAKINALTFSPDGRWLASASADQTVRIWEAATGRETQKYTEHRGWVLALAFSPDGESLASGGADHTVKLWGVTRGQLLRDLPGHSGAVQALAFSPDGAALASGSADSTVRFWRVGGGAKSPSLARAPSPVMAVAFSRDGGLLTAACADRSVRQFDTSKGREAPALAPSDALGRYEAAAFSPDLGWLATSIGDRRVTLRRLAPGGEGRTLASNANGVRAAAFSRDRRWFASGHDDNAVKLWDLRSGRQVATLAGNAGAVNAVAFSPDGDLLAAGSLGGTIKLWEIISGRPLAVAPAHGGSVNALAFSPDGKWLISASGDRTIKVWEVASGREARTLAGHASDVNALGLSADGRWLVSGSADKTVKLWDWVTGREAQTFTGHADKIFGAALSPDGRWVASASADQTVRLWEAATGRAERTLAKHAGWVYALAFSPDGRWLASGGADRVVKVWEVATGEERLSLIGHAGLVNSLGFGPDGAGLISGSEDGSTRLWALPSGELLATLVSLRESGDWLVVTPDGLFDGSPAAWSQILWRFAQNTFMAAPVEVFFNEFYYPELLADVCAGKRPRPANDISRRDRRQPQVAMTVGEAGAGRAVTVKLEVTEAPPDAAHAAGGGAHDLRLFRNGSLVRAWRGDLLRGAGVRVVEADLPVVAGENRLTAYAFNRDNVKSLDATAVVSGAESLRRRGTVFILTIGVNQYANADWNLSFALRDAEEFGTELKRQQELLGRFAEVEVVPLLDREATKANIEVALRRLAAGPAAPLPAGAPRALERLRPAAPEDLVVVFFAGHGTAQESRFYLIPHDLGYRGQRADLDEAGLREVLAHSISDEELEGPFAAIDAGQILFVIDACNSGQALEAEEKRRGPMNSKGLAQLAYEKGMNILTAAQSYQLAKEASRLGHGYLTYALVVSGLKELGADSRPADGQVLLREWLDYATEQVPQIQVAAQKEGRGLGLKRPGQKPEAAGPQEAQRPRVFYRREEEAAPLVIAKGRVGR